MEFVCCWGLHYCSRTGAEQILVPWVSGLLLQFVHVPLHMGEVLLYVHVVFGAS